MSKMPVGKMRWMSKDEIDKFQVETVEEDGEDGFILECDLDYPDSLHLQHNNLPLAPEILQVSEANLSSYAKRALIESEGNKNYKDVKLLSTFFPREKYVLHFKNLKLYLQLGMNLKKIHRILTFKQSAFIAPFIEKCTEARKIANTKFQSDQYKKLANVVYGKCLQNVRDYMVVKLHTTKKSALKAISDPTYRNHVIIDENLVQTNHSTITVKHDKPIFIGFTILELVTIYFIFISSYQFEISSVLFFTVI